MGRTQRKTTNIQKKSNICTYLLSSNDVNNLTAGHRTWKSYSSKKPNTKPTLSGCLMNISVNCSPMLPTEEGERLVCSVRQMSIYSHFTCVYWWQNRNWFLSENEWETITLQHTSWLILSGPTNIQSPSRPAEYSLPNWGKTRRWQLFTWEMHEQGDPHLH